MKSTTKKKETDLLYYWQPWCSAPRMFEVYLHYFYVKYGDDQAVTMGEEMISGGIDWYMVTSAGYVKNTIPTGFHIVYAALQERKIYEADINFQKEELEYLQNKFEQGYSSREGRDNFGIFNICILPEGRLKLFLGGEKYDRTEVLPFEYQATDSHVVDEDITKGMNSSPNRGMLWWNDANEFFDYMTYEGDSYLDLDSIKKKYGNEVYHRIKFQRERNFPMEIWHKYFERFNYDVEFVLEDKNAYLTDSKLQYSNCEVSMIEYSINPENIIKNPSCLRDAQVWWMANDVFYSAYLYFDEEEIYNILSSVFKDNKEKKGLLSIQISKYNNFINLNLTVGEEIINIEKTQIVIITIDRTNGDRECVYKNYEEYHQKEFIGYQLYPDD